MEFVTVRHPEIEGSLTEITRESFEIEREAQGWELVSDSEAVALDVTDGEVTDLSRLSKDELLDLAVSIPVAVPDAATKAQIIEAIEGARAPA